jgi:hypothetical protein
LRILKIFEFFGSITKSLRSFWNIENVKEYIGVSGFFQNIRIFTILRIFEDFWKY